MATELTTENRETGTRNRGPLTWLVAAAAVLVIAGVGFLGVRALTGDDRRRPPSSRRRPSVTRWTCRPPRATPSAWSRTPRPWPRADVAFDGTVTAIDGDQVTLKPSQWYAGEPTDAVEVTAPSGRPTDVGCGSSSAPVTATWCRHGRSGHRCAASRRLQRRRSRRSTPRRSRLMHGLLLAAGAGSRMGMPKALVRAEDGEPWLVRGVRTLDRRRLRPGDGRARRLGRRGAAAARRHRRDGGRRRRLGRGHVGIAARRAGGARGRPTRTPSSSRSSTCRTSAPTSSDASSARTSAASTLRRASYDGRVGHPVVIGRDHWAGVADETSGDRGARGYLATHDVERRRVRRPRHRARRRRPADESNPQPTPR